MTEEKEEKTQKDENYEKAALYVAFLLGMYYKSFDELKANPTDLQKVNVKIHEKFIKFSHTIDEYNGIVA